MDNIEFGSKLQQLIKEYLNIKDDKGFVSIESLDLKIDGYHNPEIKISCSKLPQ